MDYTLEIVQAQTTELQLTQASLVRLLAQQGTPAALELIATATTSVEVTQTTPMALEIVMEQ